MWILLNLAKFKRRKSMEIKKKPLPVGMDIFEKIIDSGYYYFDKTMFIKALIDCAGEVNLFTRPRRFGKTLTMSMLKAFFEIGTNKELFNGLAIEQEKKLCEQYQGQFPVVSITLKSIEGMTYEEAIEKMKMLISTECKRLGYLRESKKLDSNDIELFELFRNQKSSEVQLMYSLSALMRMLHAHYGEKVILLIDEYDVPLDKANERGYYDRMVSFFRTFFGEAFKTNPDIKFAVLTGCLRISKESIFTGINNLVVDSISDSRFDEYFGFTDDDVKRILEYYGIEDAYGEMKEWYDGYHFGDTDVYCPWDVINHCRNLLSDPDVKPKAYWNNTSSNALVKLFIDRADTGTRQDIERLTAGEAIERHMTENLTYSEIDESMENLWSVLYLTGYLTLDRKQKPNNPECVRLVIPNREVRTIFVEKIRKWFAQSIKKSPDSMNEMYEALTSGDAQKAQQIISSQLRHTISYYDSREDFYHGFMTGMLSGNREWIMRSNRENGLGRSDISIKDYESMTGMVIEIKRAAKAGDMEEKCDEALMQTEDRKYAQELEEEMDTVWIYGMAFADKTCKIKAKRLK